jgi:hypothetical protein
VAHKPMCAHALPNKEQHCLRQNSQSGVIPYSRKEVTNGINVRITAFIFSHNDMPPVKQTPLKINLAPKRPQTNQKQTGRFRFRPAQTLSAKQGLTCGLSDTLPRSKALDRKRRGDVMCVNNRRRHVHTVNRRAR